MSTFTLTRAGNKQHEVSQPETSEPQLSFAVLTRPADKIDALRLVADSIAQQRQVASHAVIFHPICLATLVGVISIAHFARIAKNDIGIAIITYSGLVLAYLLAIRYFTSVYISIAEDMDWNTWLKGPSGKDDVVLGARYGDEIIAATVVRFGEDAQQKTASIRAWTVRTRFRRHGLGGDMLREAVKVAKERRGPSCIVQFAPDHANSRMPLHSIFNGPFEKRDRSAAQSLSRVLSS